MTILSRLRPLVTARSTSTVSAAPAGIEPVVLKTILSIWYSTSKEAFDEQVIQTT